MPRSIRNDRAIAVALVLLVVVVVLGLFVGGDNPLTRTDTDILTAVADHRPAWLVDAAVQLTRLGRFDTLIPVTALGAAWFMWRARRREGAEEPGASWLVALTPLWALCVTGPVNALIKVIVERPRPPEALRAIVEHGTGYSSGHSAHAAAAWLALSLVLPQRHRGVWLAAGLLMALVVGSTRVILGVHSPTDVIGGWSLGAACALLLWQLTTRVAGRKR